jgi:hypothetical protein
MVEEFQVRRTAPAPKKIADAGKKPAIKKKADKFQ